MADTRREHRLRTVRAVNAPNFGTRYRSSTRNIGKPTRLPLKNTQRRTVQAREVRGKLTY